MTRTARRRWSREFEGEISGIAFSGEGPVWVHGYDPPVGGKWMDSVIPGKIGAFDRTSGETLWVSPCEIGYGRGFGAGPGDEDDLVVLGPSLAGHRIARMSRANGELIGMNDVPSFDQAIVQGDMTVTVSSTAVHGIMTSPMLEVWALQREGERYHLVGRDGGRCFVATTDMKRRRQGVLSVDAESGECDGDFLPPRYGVIHELVVGKGVVIVLSDGHSDAPPRAGTLVIEAFASDGSQGGSPLWSERITNPSDDDGLPDVSLYLDSGKLYVTTGAMLDVRDALSGMPLGEFAIPGLDERIAWSVAEGAGLLAEETRVSVFEIPA